MVESGQSIRYKIPISGAHPLDVHWKLNGKVLVNGSKGCKIKTKSDETIVEIKRAKPCDSGIISLTVRDAEGHESRAKATIRVLHGAAPPKPPTGPVLVRDLTSDGRGCTIQCHAPAIDEFGPPIQEYIVEAEQPSSTTEYDDDHSDNKDDERTTKSMTREIGRFPVAAIKQDPTSDGQPTTVLLLPVRGLAAADQRPTHFQIRAVNAEGVRSEPLRISVPVRRHLAKDPPSVITKPADAMTGRIGEAADFGQPSTTFVEEPMSHSLSRPNQTIQVSSSSHRKHSPKASAPVPASDSLVPLMNGGRQNDEKQRLLFEEQQSNPLLQFNPSGIKVDRTSDTRFQTSSESEKLKFEMERTQTDYQSDHSTNHPPDYHRGFELSVSMKPGAAVSQSHTVNNNRRTRVDGTPNATECYQPRLMSTSPYEQTRRPLTALEKVLLSDTTDRTQPRESQYDELDYQAVEPLSSPYDSFGAAFSPTFIPPWMQRSPFSSTSRRCPSQTPLEKLNSLDTERRGHRFGHGSVLSDPTMGTTEPTAANPTTSISLLRKPHLDSEIDRLAADGTVFGTALSDPSLKEAKVSFADFPPSKPRLGPTSMKDQTIAARKTLSFDVVIAGEPKPEVKWTINGNEIDESSSAVAINYHVCATTIDKVPAYMASLTIHRTKRSDSGLYRIEAANSEGRVSASARVTVLDVPGPPVGPLTVTKRRLEGAIVLKWQHPEDTGGAPVLYYMVDRREVESRWTNVGYTSAVLNVADRQSSQQPKPQGKMKLKNLGENDEKRCRFRVFAVNKIGKGKPLESGMQPVDDTNKKDGPIVKEKMPSEGEEEEACTTMRFDVSDKKEIINKFALTNRSTDHRMGWFVQINVPERMEIKPPHGILDPKEQCILSVILRPFVVASQQINKSQQEQPSGAAVSSSSGLSTTNDGFTIIWIRIPAESVDSTVRSFDERWMNDESLVTKRKSIVIQYNNQDEGTLRNRVLPPVITSTELIIPAGVLVPDHPVAPAAPVSPTPPTTGSASDTATAAKPSRDQKKERKSKRKKNKKMKGKRPKTSSKVPTSPKTSKRKTDHNKKASNKRKSANQRKSHSPPGDPNRPGNQSTDIGRESAGKSISDCRAQILQPNSYTPKPNPEPTATLADPSDLQGGVQLSLNPTVSEKSKESGAAGTKNSTEDVNVLEKDQFFLSNKKAWEKESERKKKPEILGFRDF